MQNLIKQIRLHLNYSQAELADRLQIAFATVNRWENGHAYPNRIAQSQLYELCRVNCVPLFDLLIQRIDDEYKDISLEPGRILLYHGSKTGIQGPIAPVSREKCDFGKGFYMGTQAEQALTLICDYEQSRLYVLSLDMTDLSVLNVPTDLEWAMLVAYHRGRMNSIENTPLYQKYRAMTDQKDLVIGSIADDRMFYCLDNFFMGNITDSALVSSLCALNLGRQYVALTQKACSAIRIEREIELSFLEKLLMKDIAEKNRSNGISLAQDICKRYRREGRFFDEILNEAKS